MGYITKKTLSHGKGVILKGGAVPADYGRLWQWIRDGWIIDDGKDSAVPPVPVPPPKSKGKAIASLDYLTETAKASLGLKGFVFVADLGKCNERILYRMLGITPGSAERLTREYDAYVAGGYEEDELVQNPIAPPVASVTPFIPASIPAAPVNSEGKAIEDLIYLNDLAKVSLIDAGVEYVADLKDWDEERLDALPGIAQKLAARLTDEFQAFQDEQVDFDNLPVVTGLTGAVEYNADADAGSQGD